jgi:hypothetical protein
MAAPDAHPAATGHTAVWTGREMIVWGGYGLTRQTTVQTGSAYAPASNTWSRLTNEGAPTARAGHTAVWGDGEMIIWGGGNLLTGSVGDGARYDPVEDHWRPVAGGAPTARSGHTAVWTGRHMIVFGGGGGKGGLALGLTGALYEPGMDRWTPLSPAPVGATDHTALWTGKEMIAWGGTPTGQSESLGLGEANTLLRYRRLHVFVRD